jgi:RHS repeat-associated protein
VARQLYDAWGNVRYVTGTLPTDIGYTGQRLDSTGLMYYRARYYAHYLNRWISPDTIVPDPKNPQSLNRYSYTYNNPVKYNDPTGHWPDWLDYALGAAYQFVNDMTFGLPNALFGTEWQQDQSYAYQDGQQAGRDASTSVNMAMAVDGTAKLLGGIAAMGPTAGGGAACTAATGGLCAAPAGGALLTEAGISVVGLLEGGIGVVNLAVASGNPLRGPKYTPTISARIWRIAPPFPTA